MTLKDLKTGRTLSHPKWGDGIVLESKDNRTTVKFLDPQHGEKKLVTDMVLPNLHESDKKPADFGLKPKQDTNSNYPRKTANRSPKTLRQLLAEVDAKLNRKPRERKARKTNQSSLEPDIVPFPFTDADFAVPERPRGVPEGYRSREGERLASPRLYYGEIVRRAALLRDLRPSLDQGLRFNEISALADQLVRMPRIFLAAREELFASDAIEKILAFQAFDITPLTTILLQQRNRYKNLADSRGARLSIEEIHHLCFEKLIPVTVVEQLYLEGYSKEAVLSKLEKLGPRELQELTRICLFRQKIARRFEKITTPARARRIANAIGVKKWARMESWMARAREKAGLSEQEALRHARERIARAEGKLEAALADAGAVRDLLFPQQQIQKAARFLFMTPYHQVVARLRQKKIKAADYLIHVNADREKHGDSITRSEIEPDLGTAQNVWLESFDRSLGTLFEQLSAEAASLGKTTDETDSPYQTMLELSASLEKLYRRDPKAARRKVRSLIRLGRAGVIFAHKMLRPAGEGGGLRENQRDLRDFVWQTIVLQSSGGRPLPLWKRDDLPETYGQVRELGRILVEGPLDSHGFARIRNEDLGRFVYPNAHYVIELFYGIPLRIWLKEPGVAYDYLLQFDNETGALSGSYHDVLDPRRARSGDVVIETDTDSKGEISVGGRRQQMMEGKTTQRVARLGTAHPWERVIIHQKDGLPLEYASQQSPERKTLAKIVDIDQDSRPVRTFQRVLTSLEFNAFTSHHGIKTLEVEGPLPKIGGEWWFRIPEGTHVIDVPRVTKALDGRTLPLEIRDVRTNDIYPKQPPYFVSLPDPDAPESSFRKTGLFHVYDGSLTRRRLARPTGKVPYNFIAEATLSEKLGALEMMGWAGNFADFCGARVEVKFVRDKKRYIKLLHDAAGAPILTRGGLPVVIDLKNRGEYWNWPDLMDSQWVLDVRASGQALTSAPNQAFAKSCLKKLETDLRDQRRQGRIPDLFMPSTAELLRAVKRAQKGPAKDFPVRLKKVFDRLDIVAEALEKALEVDVTPITAPTQKDEDASKTMERKRIKEAMTVQEALQSGFSHVRRIDGVLVPAPGYQVRRVVAKSSQVSGQLVPRDLLLEPGDVLTLLRRAPEPRVTRLSEPFEEPLFNRRQVMPLFNLRKTYNPAAMIPGSEDAKQFTMLYRRWKSIKNKESAQAMKLREQMEIILGEQVPAAEMPYFQRVLEDMERNVRLSDVNPQDYSLERFKEEVLETLEGTIAVFANQFARAHPRVFVDGKWRRNRQLVEEAQEVLRGKYRDFVEAAVVGFYLGWSQAEDDLTKLAHGRALAEISLQMAHGEYNLNEFPGGLFAMSEKLTPPGRPVPQSWQTYAVPPDLLAYGEATLQALMRFYRPLTKEERLRPDHPRSWIQKAA